MERLTGLKINSALTNPEHQEVVLDTDKGLFSMSWVGDCCARCFLAHVGGVDALIGARIAAIENTEWVVDESDLADACVESMGTTITTDKGRVTFESRVEHSGYYGGSIFIEQISELPKDLKPLTDF